MSDELERRRTREQAPYDNGEEQPPKRVAISVTRVQPVMHRRDVPITAIGPAWMYCRRCRAPMIVGTQCERCGAWCR